MIWAFLIPIFIVGLAIVVAVHRQKVWDQAHLDKRLIFTKYLKYSRIYFDYIKGEENITALNEAEHEIRELIKLYNKKYRLYGYSLSPDELLFKVEEQKNKNSGIVWED